MRSILTVQSQASLHKCMFNLVNLRPKVGHLSGLEILQRMKSMLDRNTLLDKDHLQCLTQGNNYNLVRFLL
jgi:hypothetical protein